MTAWVLVFWMSGLPISKPIQLNPQSEDACITAAKQFPLALCISEFEGVVIWFRNGKQVDKP